PTRLRSSSVNPNSLGDQQHGSPQPFLASGVPINAYDLVPINAYDLTSLIGKNGRATHGMHVAGSRELLGFRVARDPFSVSLPMPKRSCLRVERSDTIAPLTTMSPPASVGHYPSSARAVWAPFTVPPIPSSIARWPSRSCRLPLPRTRGACSDSSA